MAATADGTRLTAAHRTTQTAVLSATIEDSLRLWSLLDPTDIDVGRDAWLSAAALSVTGHHRESVTVSASYYRSFAAAELGVPRDLPRIAPTVDGATLRANLEITGPIRFKSLVARGHDGASAFATSGVAVAGAAARFALMGGRDELLGQVARDSQSLGWQRIGDISPCAFCLMLISRGPVYKGQATADFQAHDSCACTAEPVFSQQAAWTDQARNARQLWDETGDLNSFRRAVERPELHGLDSESELIAALTG